MPFPFPGGMPLAFASRLLAQVTFSAAGAGANSYTSSIAVPYPASITAGQVLVMHINCRDSVGPDITTPTGWTLITWQAVSAKVLALAYYKIADGSETGSLTVNGTFDTQTTARMYSFTAGSGVEAAGGSSATAGSTTIAMASVVTTQTLELAVALIFGQANTTVGSSTGESGGDWVEQTAEYAGATYCMQMQAATMAAAGTISGGTTTFGASAANRSILTFAILP